MTCQNDLAKLDKKYQEFKSIKDDFEIKIRDNVPMLKTRENTETKERFEITPVKAVKAQKRLHSLSPYTPKSWAKPEKLHRNTGPRVNQELFPGEVETETDKADKLECESDKMHGNTGAHQELYRQEVETATDMADDSAVFCDSFLDHDHSYVVPEVFFHIYTSWLYSQ